MKMINYLLLKKLNLLKFHMEILQTTQQATVTKNGDLKMVQSAVMKMMNCVLLLLKKLNLLKFHIEMVMKLNLKLMLVQMTT